MFFKSDKKSQDQVHGFSHLGENLRFEGEIDCKGEIEIAGKVKGNIKAKKLRILETGSVKGLVQAEDVEVLGYMVGNIESANIHIGEKGIVRGDLHFENNLELGSPPTHHKKFCVLRIILFVPVPGTSHFLTPLQRESCATLTLFSLC